MNALEQKTKDTHTEVDWENAVLSFNFLLVWPEERWHH